MKGRCGKTLPPAPGIHFKWKKAVAIAALVVGLFCIAAFVTAVQMARARMENAASDTVDAVRAAQRSGSAHGSSYINWPKNGGGR